MLRFCKTFGRNEAGLSAIEFAFIAPLMVTTYFGIAEIGNYIMADRKVTTVASTAADLATQGTAVSNAGMADIMASLGVIIQPFNPNNAPRYGKQMGAKYFVTGHISGNDERSEDMRRIQYFLYLEVVDVETSEKLFLAKSEITKAVR